MENTKKLEGQSERLQFALQAAKIAGRIALRYYQDENLAVDLKQDHSVVTRADREAEQAIRERLEKAFPEDAVVGEEFGVRDGATGWTWYLDPIDGTQAFARGVPLFGTLIGATYEGRSEIGVIFLPALGECVYAARGAGCYWVRGTRLDEKGAWVGGETKVAKVSTVNSLKDAMFCTTWMSSFQNVGRVDLFSKLCEATGVFRGWGDCYGYALVATGRAEVMVDPQLMSWDAGPMPVILEEAGGRYTSFKGEVDILAGNGFATNGHLHAAVQALI